MRRLTFTLVVGLVVISGCQSVQPTTEESSTFKEIEVVPSIDTRENTVEKESIQEPTHKQFLSTEIVDSNSDLRFSATIPSHWEVEYIADIQALNFFDPTIASDSSLEQSQVFVRTFIASDFLTLQTVTIHNRTETTISERPTVIYEIEKKAGVADFVSQPSWRSQRHVVTDIRSTDDPTTTFYVFGKRPDLEQKIFDDFINSVDFQ